MKIREATIEDASELAIVVVSSWRSAYRGVLPEAYLDALDPAERIPRWEDYLRDSDWPAKGAFVAEDIGGLMDGARKTDQIGGLPVTEARYRRDLRDLLRI